MVCCSSSPTRVEPLLDFGAVHRGPQQALAQQAAAHAGERLVERAQHGGLLLRAAGVGGEQRLDQFQVAHRDGVEHHGIGAVVVGGAVQVVERGALGIAQVVQDGAGGAHGGGAVGQAAAIERQQLEVVAQRAVGVILGEDPLFQLGAHEARRAAERSSAGEQRQIAGKQHLARAQLFQRAGHLGRVQFGHAEFARGDIHVGHGRARRPTRATAAR